MRYIAVCLSASGADLKIIDDDDCLLFNKIPLDNKQRVSIVDIDYEVILYGVCD
jgi:hypothetical protein